MSKTFYITTTLPYVNSKPHVGFAMEVIRADVIARHKRLQGYDVFFNTGTDEHGVKIYEKAQELGVTPQAFTDDLSKNFKALKETLNLSYDAFIRTTDEHHITAAQAFWKKCFDAGDIYKKAYKTKYCVGCELEKTDSELNDDGCCPIHPNRPIDIIEEENYFFRFSNYGEQLLDYYEKKNPVRPAYRLNEIKELIDGGLQDFSISRLKEKMPWGVPVPDDEEHVMYVWFDALVNYISTLGWPEDETNFNKFWTKGETVQYAGKDNVRQQSAMWQAMLFSAGLAPTDNIIINGFITADGEKMSKSLGNVIDPADIVETYGTDALRFYVLHQLTPHEDGSFTEDRFKEAYNAYLANGIGNLANRIMKMSEDHVTDSFEEKEIDLPKEYTNAFDEYNLHDAIHFVWEKITALDEKIQETAPFKLVKKDKDAAVAIITELREELWVITKLLDPLLPETSEKISQAILANTKPETPIFARHD